uniref:Uncharacterized protein n=1 Tax=Anguilla anguilla TaxID=7936 RepID=A0A0E9R4F9_ANGAN
MCGYCLFTLS